MIAWRDRYPPDVMEAARELLREDGWQLAPVGAMAEPVPKIPYWVHPRNPESHYSENLLVSALVRQGRVSTQEIPELEGVRP